MSKNIGNLLLLLLIITPVSFCCGLLGTSMGLALMIAHPLDTLNRGDIGRLAVGALLFFLGSLLLYGWLYVAWIRPRRKPVEPEVKPSQESEPQSPAGS